MPKLIILVFILIVILVSGFYLIFYTDVFKVNSLSVIGLNQQLNDHFKSRIKDKAILVGLGNPWLSLVGPGNLLFWSEYIESNFFIPQVSKFKILRDFRKKQVSLQVELRKPYGILCKPETSDCFWFDNQGVLFDLAPKAKGQVLINVTDYRDCPIKLGSLVFEQEKLIENFLFYLKELKNSDLPIININIKPEELREVEVLTSGPKIYLNLEFKFKDFCKLIKEFFSQKDFSSLNYIDLRVKNKIIYHPESE